jgi:NIPSNAP
MKTFVALGFVCSSLVATAADTRCYELRTYTAAPGKLDALHARFRDHTTKLFEKHGMTNVGYWVPVENKENKLIYLLSFDTVPAREAAWKGFISDPDWKAAHKASEENGPLVSRIESTLLHATDFSPEIKPSRNGDERSFELRTYTAAEGRLPNLLARFREHTVALFAKHGITNFGYWVPNTGQPGADVTLVYLLAHKSPEARASSFKAFGADPAWVAAKDASEKAAGGPLTAKDGVKSAMLKPTDYSKTK